MELKDTSFPLVVDFDKTCIKTDLRIECLLSLLRQHPRYLFLVPFWLLRGKEYFAEQIARRASLDVALLPYRTDLLEYLKMRRAEGRTILLATTNNRRTAQQIADHLKLFDGIISSDGSTYVAGKLQRDLLMNRFGEKRFDYATSGCPNIAILSSARRVILVNPSARVRLAAAAGKVQVDRIFEARSRVPADYLAPLRAKHWLKNLLVFVPVFLTHRYDEISLLERSVVAFIALCCCASSGYLFNDLLDLAADRRHPTKRLRPFAAGDLGFSYALIMIPGLVALGCGLGALISARLVESVLTYFVLTLAYTLYFKRVALLDVLVLAGLYTLRILVGSVAVSIWPPHWLLAFSMFLFLSLALLKRYSELVVMRKIEGQSARARGYEVGDAELLVVKGTASGYLAVLVLALYIVSSSTNTGYGRHQLIWLLCPLLLYWIGQMWLIAYRGKMTDDPVVFAMTDGLSRLLILLMVGTAVLAL
jgi:4-hydroxybenzoate polyprenyltransferase